jgi:hypothetical protein
MKRLDALASQYVVENELTDELVLQACTLLAERTFLLYKDEQSSYAHLILMRECLLVCVAQGEFFLPLAVVHAPYTAKALPDTEIIVNAFSVERGDQK